MTKKTVGHPARPVFPSPEWNAELKESWHFDFDKEPVNDEKWSCIVTAAIQAEVRIQNSRLDDKYSLNKIVNIIYRKVMKSHVDITNPEGILSKRCLLHPLTFLTHGLFIPVYTNLGETSEQRIIGSPEILRLAAIQKHLKAFTSTIADRASSASYDQNENYIEIYTQSVKTGLRKAVKIISMADVVKLLKETGKLEKPPKQERNLKPFDHRFPQIVELAANFATFSDAECKLPSDLMAAVLKFMILSLKSENCFEKRVAAARERKVREQKIKEKFIRDLKPYEAIQREKRSSNKISANILELENPIDDEPICGPDLYILLTDFFDAFVFPELLKINVPFLAILKVSHTEDFGLKLRSPILVSKSESFEKKKSVIKALWKILQEEEHLENSMKFKDIAILKYNAVHKHGESKLNFFRTIFDELTWMQYSVYFIHRQHQKFLKELYVQRLILSLEPLDLSKCEIYNKLCDLLITGEPLTPLLVLFAIVEQVVAGVPHTESVALEYEPQFTDFFPCTSEPTVTADDSSSFTPDLDTSCKCREKQYESMCEKLKKCLNSNFLPEKIVRKDSFGKSSISRQNQNEDQSSDTSKKLSKMVCSENSISESLLLEVMRDKKSEKEMRKDKRWKTPGLCLYGDFVFLETYFCDSRLLNPNDIIERFLKNAEFLQIWKKYPELLPEEKAFFNFHFFNLWKNSTDCEEKLKLKILFTHMSMRLISIKKSNLFLGEEEKRSDILPTSILEKPKTLSTKIDKKNLIEDDKRKPNFTEFFSKMFFKKTSFKTEKTFLVEPDKKLHKFLLKSKSYFHFHNSQVIHKIKSQIRMITPISSKSVLNFSPNFNTFDISKNNRTLPPKYTEEQVAQKALFSLIDCSEISNLIDHNFFRDKADLNYIENYKFYENLSSNLMIQRLTEAQARFNTIEYSYFPPTDNVIVIMFNDSDGKGMFFLEEHGVLPTPVSLRDFYSYVYPKIKKWKSSEHAEYKKFMTEVEEKEKAKREKQDLKYLARLKKKYCEMSEEKRKEFLETDLEVQVEPEITEKELRDLPDKLKPQNSEKISFVVMNFIDVQTETSQKNIDFYSSDGTEIHSAIETWLYAPLKLHKLAITKSNLTLYYNQWLDNEEINFSFNLKTTSNIIFSFYKDDSGEMDYFNYLVTISWPTGLLIKPSFYDSSAYIKQSYLKTYRKGWDIEEELSRCFLKNGQVLIFKENGNYDILCGSGTKYIFKDSGSLSKYEIISTTGEVWEVRSNNPCRNRKELIASSKVFIGVDPKTQETFYRREDGTHFMLWPNGTLVTKYPDGTKITSIPYFEEREVTINWTEEEELYHEEPEAKYKSDISVQEPRSRTIPRNISVPLSIEKKSFVNESFVSVLCTYVMEHPKYSTVYFTQNSFIKMKMPEQLIFLIHPDGNYEVQQEKNFLKVDNGTVQFYTNCEDCSDQSMVTLNLNSNKLLCQCVDFFKKAFFVFRNGKIRFNNFYEELSEDTEEPKLRKRLEKLDSTSNKCITNHYKKVDLMERCFALDRNLNGMEFIHANTLGQYGYHLPEETYFDISTDDPLNISCTFSSPHYKIGYEKWVMDYENVEDSLPTNLKKKDLKELGTKEIPQLFKYAFPQKHSGGQQNEKRERVLNKPKLVIGRTIRCLCQEPSSVINDMQNCVTEYQKKAEQLYEKYNYRKNTDDQPDYPNSVDRRLKKITLSLNQNLQAYPHLGTQFPSTEKDIHYFGHLINSMDAMKTRSQDDSNILPDCRQIPQPLPRSSDLPNIDEEIESPRDT